MSAPLDLGAIRAGLAGYDPSVLGLPASLVVIRRDTLERLIAECEAARSRLSPPTGQNP